VDGIRSANRIRPDTTHVSSLCAYPGLVQTDELWDDEEPESDRSYVDGAWGRTANPNSVEGELQNLAAFGTGLTRLSGPRRTAAKVIVWLILIGTVLAIIYSVFGIVVDR
jgi:hypothetical protein